MNQTKNYTLAARSKRNGIIFYSNICPFLGCETFLDSSGKINNEVIYMDSKSNSFSEVSKQEKPPSKWKIIVFDILLIITCILLKNINLIIAAFYFSLVVSFDFFRFLKVSYHLKLKKGINYSTGKFHAAEHMVLNAYEKLQRVPTLEELKSFSRFSKSCGSRSITDQLILEIIVSLCLAFGATLPIPIYLLLLVIVCTFVIISIKTGLFRFAQILLTNKPSDKELQLAIEGIKNFEEMENSIYEDFIFSLPEIGQLLESFLQM